MPENTLYDAMVRHQVYLEGFKAHQGSKFSDTAKAIETDIKRRIDNLEYDTLDVLTKAQLKQFIRELQGVNRRLFDAYTVKLIAELEAFCSADYELNVGILDDTLKPEEQDRESKDDEEPAGLWASIVNDPIPGVGLLISPFLIGVGLSFLVRTEKLITQAWSNGTPKKELLNELIGEPPEPGSPVGKAAPPKAPDPEKQPSRDPLVPTATDLRPRQGGLVNKVIQENQSSVNTAIQHVSQGTAEAAQKKRFLQYRWVSVLDSRTTTICRERNGRVYRYGAGPLPPAHINCRSHIVPFFGD